jgi:threonine dehydrogenase-like Zn-dependent dehydrogenase
MRGVIFLGDRKLDIINFEDPTPGTGEVVLEIKASGMCGSDLGPYRLPADAPNARALPEGGPAIRGHEPCGVVVAVGPGVPPALASVGMRAMVHHYSGCGVCPHCRSGWAQMCVDGSTVYGGGNGHGAHADFMKVPAFTLVPLPDELSFATGAAISCGAGTAFGALGRMNLSGRDTIAVFGQGPVGLSATQFGAAMGARVIAVDISDERLALAKGFGAEITINAVNDDPVAAIRDVTHGLGAEKTLDCTGTAKARRAAVQAAGRWGVACFVGEGNDVTIDVSPDMIRKQLTILASWTFSTGGQAECAQFVVDRGIEVEKLFTDRYTLDQAEEAYTLFDQQKTGKGVFLM